MDYIRNELVRVQLALHSPRAKRDPELQAQLYMAQQALKFALDPLSCKAPLDMALQLPSGPMGLDKALAFPQQVLEYPPGVAFWPDTARTYTPPQ